MRIVQVLPTLAYGDAIGNEVFAISEMLYKRGFETEIYAESIDPRLAGRSARLIDQLFHLSDRDVLIYHMSTGTRLNYDIQRYGGRLMMVYHNITPPDYFNMYSREAVRITTYGYEGLKHLIHKMQYCIADSDFNRNDLLRMGYTCPIEVCPILISFDDYRKNPSQEVLKKCKTDEYENILFVGRISPNKKQEDIIHAFYYYQKYYNPKSRLFLVGSASGMESYQRRLSKYVDSLHLSGKVYFLGHVRFDEILAYYQIADLFVCMSDHEGFCVPLVEAMFFGVPVVAYCSSAISETLGKGGILLDSKDPRVVASAMNRIHNDKNLRNEIKKTQEERLKEYDPVVVEERFWNSLQSFLN